MTLIEQNMVNYLIREGEQIYGYSEEVSHRVLEHVQEGMIARGMRIKVDPRPLPPLPIKGKEYYKRLERKIFGTDEAGTIQPTQLN